MPYSATVFNVMIASPGDLNKERDVVRDVVNEWNTLHSFYRKTVLLPISWETHSTPLMGDRPQAIINKQVLKQSDLLIAFFWTRLGTATGKANSGTVEEIEEHINSGKPTLLYFSSADIPQNQFNNDQFQSLQAFKNKCQDQGLYRTFNSVDDFRNQVRSHLNLMLNEDIFFNVNSKNSVGTDDRLSSLSHEAKEVLLKATEENSKGEILIVSTRDGFHVQTGDRNFVGDNDSRKRAIWEGAIEELTTNGFLKISGSKGEIYRVTTLGYTTADKLKEQKYSQSKLISAPNNGRDIIIQFRNPSKTTLNLMYVDSSGNEKNIKELKSEDFEQIKSFINHAWLVRNAENNGPIIEFKASEYFEGAPGTMP